MKTIIFKSSTIIICALFLFSCGSTKKMTQIDKKIEILDLPCSGSEYMSSKKAFRDLGTGDSMDLSTSRKKALSNARAAIAETVNATIKKVEDNFVNSLEENNQEQIREKFTSNIRTVVNTTIQGSIVVCEKTQINKETGKYTTFIVVELSTSTLAQDIMNNIKAEESKKVNENKSLDKEAQIRVEFDYDRYQDTFNKVLEDFKNE